MFFSPASTLAGLEDGVYEGAPVWAALYHCLRCGDRAAAAAVAANAGPGLAEAHKLINEAAASPDGKLGPHSENVVRLAYRRSVRATTDPYKRAVYCVLGACDPQDEHGEVATSLDDYLWIKLSQIRCDDPGLDSSSASASASAHAHADALTLPQLQVRAKKANKASGTCLNWNALHFFFS